MRILILDDDKFRLKIFNRKLIGAVVTCVETEKECIREIQDNDPFDFIFLDHDLYGKVYVPSGPGTGYEVALWIKDHPEKKPGKVILHTCNEHGIVKMREVLPDALPLSGLFMIDFNLADLDTIREVYARALKKVV